MNGLLLFFFLIPLSFGDGVFRFHLFTEPSRGFDPQISTATSGNYIGQNVFRGLMRYDNDKGLVPEGAASCVFARKGLRVDCKIARDHLWSDGQPVVAGDYVRSFRRLVHASNKSPQVELLLTVKNALAIWREKMPVEKLGVEAVGKRTVRFHLEHPDSEFLYKLAQPALAPIRYEAWPAEIKDLLTTGPYRIVEWKKGDRVVMEPNPHYRKSRRPRPKVEALFVDDDSTALRLYQAGKLSILRRLLTAEIPVYRNKPEFMQWPMARFDYIGFSEALRNYPKLRKALSLSLDFNNFRELFDALGRPGCPSLPERLFFGPLCLDFDAATAKKLYEEEPWPKNIPKQFGFSKMGGDDIQRSAEWFQGQWKKNLGVLLDLQSQEQGVYLNRLKTSPPPAFRKGVSLDRPTCLAALENFDKENPENYIKLDSKKYFEVLEKLKAETRPTAIKKLCTEGIKILIQENWLIPLGEIHFTFLTNRQFSGWKVNTINHLDLTDLHKVDPK